MSKITSKWIRMKSNIIFLWIRPSSVYCSCHYLLTLHTYFFILCLSICTLEIGIAICMNLCFNSSVSVKWLLFFGFTSAREMYYPFGWFQSILNNHLVHKIVIKTGNNLCLLDQNRNLITITWFTPTHFQNFGMQLTTFSDRLLALSATPSAYVSETADKCYSKFSFYFTLVSNILIHLRLKFLKTELPMQLWICFRHWNRTKNFTLNWQKRIHDTYSDKDKNQGHFLIADHRLTGFTVFRIINLLIYAMFAKNWKL